MNSEQSEKVTKGIDEKVKRKTGVYQRLKRANELGTGMYLTADDVWELVEKNQAILHSCYEHD